MQTLENALIGIAGTKGDADSASEVAKGLAREGVNVSTITFPGSEKLYTDNGQSIPNLEVLTLAKSYEVLAGSSNIFEDADKALKLVRESGRRFEVAAPLYLECVQTHMQERDLDSLEGYVAIVNDPMLNILGPSLVSLGVSEFKIAAPYVWNGVEATDKDGNVNRYSSQFVQPYDDSFFAFKRAALNTLSRTYYKPIGDELSRSKLGNRHKDVSFDELYHMVSDTIIMNSPLFYRGEDFFTGYPIFESDTPLPENIEQFLSYNEKLGKHIITAAYGSMGILDENKKRLIESRIKAIEGTDFSLVVAGMDLDKLGVRYDPNKVAFHPGFINYPLLFGRSRVVDSHFGAGTGENTLAAGALFSPLIFFGDQAYRARNSYERLGVSIGEQTYKELKKSGFSHEVLKENLKKITSAQIAKAQFYAMQQERISAVATEKIVQRILGK